MEVCCLQGRRVEICHCNIHQRFRGVAHYGWSLWLWKPLTTSTTVGNIVLAGLSTIMFNRESTCRACFEIRYVDHILWCLLGSPSVVVIATNLCAPNYGLSAYYGGWCNFPREHFETSEAAFAEIDTRKSDIVPVQYRRVECKRGGGMKFTMSGSNHFCQVLIANVGLDGEVVAVKVKGMLTGWIPMARNWGQNWHCNVNLQRQPLSFEVTINSGKTVTSYNVAPANWQFGQAFEGK